MRERIWGGATFGGGGGTQTVCQEQLAEREEAEIKVCKKQSMQHNQYELERITGGRNYFYMMRFLF